MRRRRFVKSLGLGVASLAVPGLSAGLARGKPRKKPNILLIMSDDHPAQAMSCYGSRINKTPAIDRIARGGMRFDNCFCTNGICAPSRAVILTGKYSHLNGLRDNNAVFDGAQQTFPKLLQRAGYQTALVGKWHLKSDPTGFDYWNVLPGQGDYYNPEMIEMGRTMKQTGYVTDLITDRAVDFIENGRDKGKPFLLMLHHKAPHRNWQPALRHLDGLGASKFAEPPTLFDDYSSRSRAALEQEMTIKDHLQLDYDLKMGPPPPGLNEEQKAAWERAYGPKREAFEKQKPEGKELVRWKYQRYLEDYLACVQAVDEGIGRTLDYLERSGLAENTAVIYTSDQGFFLGEHGWFDKRFMYEEALRMPLLVRYPGRIRPGSVRTELASNLDFAPTLLALAGLRKPAEMQGESLRGLLEGKKPAHWRGSVYYHYYEYPAVHMVKRHYGVRTRRYKLIHFYYDIDAWELYDLEKDPHELDNVYDEPAYAGVRAELLSELRRLQKFYGDSDALARKFVEEDLAKT